VKSLWRCSTYECLHCLTVLFILTCGLVDPCSSAQVTVFETVPVGNPSTVGYGPNQIFGWVDYSYRIGKTEVTNNQYVDFLNNVATSDPAGLYNPLMGSDASGGILRTGADSSYNYSIKSGQGQNPVVFVSWYDSIRFANWLDNGKPTGPQGTGTTEDGAYTIDSGGGAPIANPIDGLDIRRNAGSMWFLASENEWTKAAYNKNDGVDYEFGFQHFWRFANQYTSGANANNPVSEPPSGGIRSANYYNDEQYGGYAVTGSSVFDPNQNYLIDVGAYTNAVSAYGTFDQGGNAWEWNDTYFNGVRGGRGGSWRPWDDVSDLNGRAHELSAGHRSGANPLDEDAFRGFRIATVPEPCTLLLAASVLFVMAAVPRSRSNR